MQKTLQSFLRNYLRILAHLQIQKFKFISRLKKQQFTIVALTGSAGKTSTIQACEAALQDNFKVKTNKNYNSEFGLPANILDFKLDDYSPASWAKIFFLSPLRLLTKFSPPEIYLMEMDVDGPHEPSNISYLLRIVQPDIGIHLNTSTVHTQNFDALISKHKSGLSRTEYAKRLMCREQSVLTRSLNKNQTAIINPDDPLVWQTQKNIKAKIIPIVKVKINFKNYALPSVYETTFGTAIALSSLFNIPEKQATKNIQKNFSLPPSRASLFTGKNNSKIIDGTYNSSPQPAYEFLKLLSSYSDTRKIAILGDMRELGHQSAFEHKRLAKLAVSSADIILTTGPETKKYFPKSKNIHKFLYYWQVIDFIQNSKFQTQDSTILVKGSQNTIYLEEVVKALLKNPSDTKNLCRQSPYWLKIKEKFKKKNS